MTTTTPTGSRVSLATPLSAPTGGGANGGHSAGDLYDFLEAAELERYYAAFMDDLRVTSLQQLKYVEESDLIGIKMSKPEIRRLLKMYKQKYPKGTFGKLRKKLLRSSTELDQIHLAANGFSASRPSASHSGAGRQSSSSPATPSRRGADYEIPLERLSVDFKLGNGEFGVVQQGAWTNEDGERIQVAIKCLAKERLHNALEDFKKEANHMHGIDHQHVVKLFGVAFDENQAPMLVTELAPLRSLLECLKEPSLRPSFPVHVLCDFAAQIASGMAHLEERRLIHRDLAARNVLVFAKDKVKISDFGLSRALGVGKDYYQTNFNVNLKLPIAWCAPECINFLRFTSFSDVWAFGVTLWEMFSYGFAPWAALTGQQILTAIDEPNFQRLEQPNCCPKEHYAVMRKTWEHEPKSRPTFALLFELMRRIEPEVRRATQDFPDPEPRKDFLFYKSGDIITVLDKKPTGAPLWNMWKGSIGGGKTGLFNPDHTTPHNPAIEVDTPKHPPKIKLPKRTQSLSRSNPTSPISRAFRAPSARGGGTARAGLTKEMISLPKGDLVHKTHVGIGGDVFGDVHFLGENYQRFPAQRSAMVKPYDSTKDLISSSHSFASINTINAAGEIFSDKAPLLKNRSGSSSPTTPTTPTTIGSPTTPTADWDSTLKEEEEDEQKISGSPGYQEVDDDDMNFDLGPSFMDEVLKALNSSQKDDASPPLKTPTTVSFAFPKSSLGHPPPPPPGVPPPDTPTPTNSMTESHGGGSPGNSIGGSDPDTVSMAPSEVSCVDSLASESEPLIRGKVGKKFDFLDRLDSRKSNGHMKPLSKSDAKSLDDAIAMAESLAKQSLQEEDVRRGGGGGGGSGSDGSDEYHGTREASPKSRKRFSQILKKSNSNASAEHRTFCSDGQRTTSLDEELTPEAQEAYNILVGSLGRDKKKERRGSYKSPEAQHDLPASTQGFHSNFQAPFTSSPAQSPQKPSISHPILQHSSNSAHLLQSDSSFDLSHPASKAPHHHNLHQSMSANNRPTTAHHSATPSPPPPAPRDPTKNPPLFSPLESVASSSSSSSSPQHQNHQTTSSSPNHHHHHHHPLPHHQHQANFQHPGPSPRRAISRSQSATTSDSTENQTSPLRIIRDRGWRPGSSRSSTGRHPELPSADPYGNPHEAHHPQHPQQQHNHLHHYGYTSFQAPVDDEEDGVDGHNGSNHSHPGSHSGSHSGSSLGGRSKTPPSTAGEVEGAGDKISNALAGSITSLPSVPEDVSSSSSSLNLPSSSSSNLLPLPPRKPSLTPSTGGSGVAHVNSKPTRNRKIPTMLASDNMLRMAGLTHGGAGGSSDISKKKSHSLESRGDNRSGSDNDSTNASHSSTASLTGPDYAQFPPPGAAAPFQANAAFFNAISSEDLHSPTIESEESPSPPGHPTSSITPVTSTACNINDQFWSKSPLEDSTTNLEVWEWQC